MMVTSDDTPLSAMSTDTKTGSPTRKNPAVESEPGVTRPPPNRFATTKTRTGNKIDPNAPSGSRRKILISSQVSFQSPRSIAQSLSIANRMAGEFQKDVLEVGRLGAEVGDPDPIFGETLDHLGHEVVAPALKSEPGVLAYHVLNLWNRSKTFFGEGIPGRQDHRSRGGVPPHQFLRSSNVDDLSVFDDRHAVAQALSLLHQMS